MTEELWLKTNDPQSMIRHLIGTDEPRIQDVPSFPSCRVSDRKLRLFACACYHRVRHRMPNQTAEHVLAISEQYADREVSWEQFNDASILVLDLAYLLEERWRASRGVEREQLTPLHESLALAGVVSWDAAQKAAYYASSNAYLAQSKVPVSRLRRWLKPPAPLEQIEKTGQIQLLRDIFGNPFRPVAFDGTWHTSTAVGLAQAIYADRAFDRLPILADALQDAGCEDADILAHCRGEGPHVRGCWAVDLVLGKT